MSEAILKRIDPASLPAIRRVPLDPQTLTDAGQIVEAVRRYGAPSLRAYAERFDGVRKGDQLLIDRDEIRRRAAGLDASSRAVLERSAERIGSFADAQRCSVREFEHLVPGGVAGQSVAPVERAGCYAPGGRYPLPSSVLMTAVTARAAGVESVLVASPNPSEATYAAAEIAGADEMLVCGGAHAVAAMAYGIVDDADPLGACDAIAGPGNRWVTAAKQLVSGVVRIDMLAGPSELLIIADRTADPATVAADLLAQAEHDEDASVVLVTTDESLLERVNDALAAQLETLPTAGTARVALRHSCAVVVGTLEEAAVISDRVAPEHLELLVEDADALRPSLSHYGGLFVGTGAAEVLGDYGAGPNHTLPTGGTARSSGGLSVFDFLRVRTWLRVDDDSASRPIVEDAVSLARIEGLEAHARSAEQRL
ncbi:MAG: histidinol dehydrogenase [Planctomycetota bacterium]